MGDGFGPAERRERLHALLAAYGTDAGPSEVVAVLRHRLLELAEFSDHAAQRLDKPGLRDDARLYRTDAARLPAF